MTDPTLDPPTRSARLVQPDEWGRLILAFSYHFILLGGYYLLRPIREEIGSANREELSLLWTGTFFAMLLAAPLLAWVVKSFRRGVFIPVVYRFFAANLILLALALAFGNESTLQWTERLFYVWLSVFNLFAITVFWGFMADVHGPEAGARLFGLVALGGTLGAMAGSLLADRLLAWVPLYWIPIAAAVLLELTLVCVRRLDRHSAPTNAGDDASKPIGGGVWSGLAVILRSRYLLGIGLYILIYTLTSTFAYYEQANIVGDAITDRTERGQFFARLNLAINGLTAIGQILVTGRIMPRFGTGRTLVILPLVSAAGFIALGLAPTLATITSFQLARRATNFAFAKPAREVLFTVLSREDKYKAKAFLDTVVYRGGDLVGAWAFDGLRVVGLALGPIAFVIVPLTAVWALVSLSLGRAQRKLAESREKTRVERRDNE